ncbi:hypothetical protein KAR48_08840 [bacterium]|nr:hypothetical protein [bacterium]
MKKTLPKRELVIVLTPGFKYYVIISLVVFFVGVGCAVVFSSQLVGLLSTLLFLILFFRILHKVQGDTFIVNFEKKKLRYPGLEIIKILVSRNHSNVMYATYIFMISLVITIFTKQYNVGLNSFPLYVFFVVLVGYIRQSLLLYRVKKGVYGFNRHEAIELIRFIVKEQNKIDFKDGGVSKRVFPDTGLAQFERRLASDYGFVPGSIQSEGRA